MANQIRFKRASGSDPSASDLAIGEPGLRTDTAELFFKKDDGSVAKVSGGGGGPNFKYLELRNAANNGAASYPGNDFTLVTAGTTTAITPVAANTLLVSVSGVIQKPNSGTSTSGITGFIVDGSRLKTATNLPAAPDFILYQESGGIGEPSDNTVSTDKIIDDAVTYAKIQNVSATNRILGRDSSGAGVIEEITPANLRTMINVEDGATGDQSNSEIKTAYEANSNTNAFTDALLSKLNGIEASATADQSASEIVALIADQTIAPSTIDMEDDERIKLGASDDLQIYHSGSDSWVRDLGTGNLYLDTQGAKISLISDGNQSTGSMAHFNKDGSVQLFHNNVERFTSTSTGATITGNLAVTGTVDGRDLATDGTKLDGIEASATADQTASEILTLIKTVDGAGSGLAADTLDGVSSTQFLRSDTNDTTTGNLTISKSGATLTLLDTDTSNSTNAILNFDDGNQQGVALKHVEHDGDLPASGYGLILTASASNTQFPSTGTLSLSVLGNIYAGATSIGSVSRVLTTADEGSGNGLDADTLDGQQGSYYTNAANLTGTLPAIDGSNLTGINSTTNLSTSTSTTAVTIASSSGNNASISEASGSAAGVMSVAHHNKLDGIAAGATNVTNNNQLTNGAGYVTSSGNTIIGTDSDINTSGATVVDQLNMTDGVITSHSTRTLTLANLGYTGATNANNISNNNQISNGAGYISTVHSARSASSNGYVRYRDGTQIAYGNVNLSNGGWTTKSFATAFPSVCRAVVTVPNDSTATGSAQRNHQVRSVNRSNFQGHSGQHTNPCNHFYIAIGY